MPSPAGCYALCRLGAFALIAIAQVYEKIVAPDGYTGYRTRTSCNYPDAWAALALTVSDNVEDTMCRASG
jgi:hypothetical protein